MLRKRILRCVSLKGLFSLSLISVSPWRTERINQQYRDDVVNRVRMELRQEHEDHVEQLTVEHQQQLLQLQ